MPHWRDNMATRYEEFFNANTFAVVGNAEVKNFPELTYKGLKLQGKTVYAVDPGLKELQGDTVYPDLASLPGAVDRVVLEVPKKETKSWMEQAATAGINDVWIHMNRETPEALDLAKEKGINVCHGTCAVMYVTPGYTYHSIHKFIMKVVGKY